MRSAWTTIVLDGHVMNPHLHIALHEVVAERLWADDPPATWSTAQHLSGLGYHRHEVLHMLMSAVGDEFFHAMQLDATPQGPRPDPGRVVGTARKLGGAAQDAASEQG